MKSADVLIIGSGIAALQLALTIKKEFNVIILTKTKIKIGNSYLAQGGVAAALAENDQPYLHFQDTLEAGRFHNDSEAAESMTKEAAGIIKELIALGCPFDQDDSGRLKLGMEGAHSRKRIVHSGGDATGKAIMDFMISKLTENISLQEDAFVYELLMDGTSLCIGVKAKLADGTKRNYFAPHTVIATGGCGQLFRYTSNADTVTGDGLALAYRAGAELVDMEFMQFHPTLLYVDGETKGLISEAVRGEGARLVTDDGTFIMESVHPLKDLAPRHVVSQTIYDYRKNGQQVYLDINSIEHFSERFPTVSSLCEKSGVDVKQGKLPVAPGSHFLMGGIKTDQIGRSSIDGLYAIGEAACTGVHGANRLASNSLLEGIVFGKRLGQWLNRHPQQPVTSMTDEIRAVTPRMRDLRLPEKEVLQQTMMDRTGIVRTSAALTMQKSWLESYGIQSILDAPLDDYSKDEISKIFMLTTAWLITDAALARTESRGGHFRADYPAEDPNWMKKQLVYIRKREKDGQYEQIETALTT